MKFAVKSHPKSERGVALLTAMIIVTLVATLASAMAWHQYRAVQVEAGERARAQAGWILLGALDWARLILREDEQSNLTKTNWDHLGEVWAVPLAEARLSTFLADKGSSDDDSGPDAFLSGSIDDAQSRYNLRNVMATGPAGVVERHTLERICQYAGAPSDTAERMITSLQAAWANPPASDAPLAPVDLDEMAWLGFDPALLAQLSPFLTILPVATPVNLNTAPSEVIAALFDGMDLASAERLVQGRRGAPLAKPSDAAQYFPQGVIISSERASVNSNYFIVTGQLRLDEHVLVQRSMVRRNASLQMDVIERRRVAQITQDPTASP